MNWRFFPICFEAGHFSKISLSNFPLFAKISALNFLAAEPLSTNQVGYKIGVSKSGQCYYLTNLPITPPLGPRSDRCKFPPIPFRYVMKYNLAQQNAKKV